MATSPEGALSDEEVEKYFQAIAFTVTTETQLLRSVDPSVAETSTAESFAQAMLDRVLAHQQFYKLPAVAAPATCVKDAGGLSLTAIAAKWYEKCGDFEASLRDLPEAEFLALPGVVELRADIERVIQLAPAKRNAALECLRAVEKHRGGSAAALDQPVALLSAVIAAYGKLREELAAHAAAAKAGHGVATKAIEKRRQGSAAVVAKTAAVLAKKQAHRKRLEEELAALVAEIDALTTQNATAAAAVARDVESLSRVDKRHCEEVALVQREDAVAQAKEVALRASREATEAAVKLTRELDAECAASARKALLAVKAVARDCEVACGNPLVLVGDRGLLSDDHMRHITSTGKRLSLVGSARCGQWNCFTCRACSGTAQRCDDCERCAECRDLVLDDTLAAFLPLAASSYLPAPRTRAELLDAVREASKRAVDCLHATRAEMKAAHVAELGAKLLVAEEAALRRVLRKCTTTTRAPVLARQLQRLHRRLTHPDGTDEVHELHAIAEFGTPPQRQALRDVSALRTVVPRLLALLDNPPSSHMLDEWADSEVHGAASALRDVVGAIAAALAPPEELPAEAVGDGGGRDQALPPDQVVATLVWAREPGPTGVRMMHRADGKVEPFPIV